VISVFVLTFFLLFGIIGSFTDGLRRHGMGILLIVVVATGVVWAAHIPLA
jgi:hypothetical protein